MALLKIARMGHPVLRQMAEIVSQPDAPEIRRLADDMVDTMRDAPGVGLAAPQIHQSVRLIVFRAPDEAGELSRVVRLVNPEMVVLDDEPRAGWEGCLSIPDLRGIVMRPNRIRWSGITPEGEPVEEEAEGYAGRIFQHELDHLNGVLYLDRMPDLRLLTFPEHLERFQEDEL